MHRRDSLKLIGAAAALLASRPVLGADGPRGPFVLVHGAWHGGWCWRHVRDRLIAAGHEVYTPTLTGQGERHHLTGPDITLDTHIEDVARVIEWEELDGVVLVGHSYGGYVVTGVADRLRDRLARVVYLDALIPTDGRAMSDASTPEQMAAVRASLIDGYRLPSPPPAWFGVPETDAANTAWLTRRLTDMPFACLTTPARLPNGGADGLTRTFIRCTAPPLLPGLEPAAARARARAEGWDYHELATGHDAMVTAPAALADLLLARA